MKEVYRPLYINEKPILHTNIETAEMIKYASNAFLALKIVEIIGEDDANILDPETIYFITNILNRAKLTKLRNKVLISSLPFRR